MQFTQTQLDASYIWLCNRRHNYPDHADIWHLRFHWEREKVHLYELHSNKQYQMSPLQKVQKADGEVIHLWSAQDALVLKALSNILTGVLPISPACAHVKGHGGLKATIRNVHDKLSAYHFVLRTDVKGYYASIDHFLLMDQLAEYIKDKFILNLLWQYLHRVVEGDGLYKEVKKGISRGCPLSPLIGAFFLFRLDSKFRHAGLFYVRYMDDILILTPTCWKLRRAVKTLNETFTALKLKKHPDKTFIGRIEKGFDFLGYQFSPNGLSVADKTIENFVARLHRLYEQQKKAPNGAIVLGDYVRRWCRWVRAGLSNLVKSTAAFVSALSSVAEFWAGEYISSVWSVVTALETEQAEQSGA